MLNKILESSKSIQQTDSYIAEYTDDCEKYYKEYPYIIFRNKNCNNDIKKKILDNLSFYDNKIQFMNMLRFEKDKNIILYAYSKICGDKVNGEMFYHR